MAALFNFYLQASKWANENQGVISVVIFLVTMAFGWLSGIFSSLRRKPKFKLAVINGPTFCCTYETGRNHNGHKIHRTGVALYLAISNIGSAASSIRNIQIGYHWDLKPFSWLWFRNAVGWFWLRKETVSLTDFQVKLGSRTKVFPFLTQMNDLLPNKAETFLQVGQYENGVVYFEQTDSWGGCRPVIKNGHVLVKVAVTDVFGKKHTAKFNIPSVTMESAKNFNPSFGDTHAVLRGEKLPEMLSKSE